MIGQIRSLRLCGDSRMNLAGFLVNPIAGMGGRVGLKGTDGVVQEAIELGARPTANEKARETLKHIRRLLMGSSDEGQIHWVTCSSAMGVEALTDAGFANLEVLHQTKGQTTDEDTKTAVGAFLNAGVELILFCGGDGTARDICSVAQQDVPILGIPAGVKMYSGVFGTSTKRTAEIFVGYLERRLTSAPADILDLDEDRYRRGEWAVRLYASAQTPYEPTFTQAAKILISEHTDRQVKEEIASQLLEDLNANPDVLFLLGSGSTLRSVGDLLGIDKTLLGIDAVANGKIVGKDLNERAILELIECYPHRRLILSPIGAQGFVLGRGNLQLSPDVIRKIGSENIIIVATPAKLGRTPALRFDTGDAALDAELTARGYLRVITGYHRKRLVKATI